MFGMLKCAFSHIVDNSQVNGPILHMSVMVIDIETKLFNDSDDQTVLRPENTENVRFRSNSNYTESQSR